jgi:hypothetical protein
MRRNYLAHRAGDAVNAVLAATGYNFHLLCLDGWSSCCLDSWRLKMPRPPFRFSWCRSTLCSTGPLYPSYKGTMITPWDPETAILFAVIVLGGAFSMGLKIEKTSWTTYSIPSPVCLEHQHRVERHLQGARSLHFYA